MILSVENHLLTCSFKENFGVECLGCGTQRSFLALMRGDLIQSFLHNPGVIFILLTFITSFVVYKYFPKFSFRVIVTSFSITVFAMTISYVFKIVGG
jgi:hypothetical protein